ncbi:MAG: hypothetical protein HQ534_00205 [Armatimonadetes bacterium]|nr:hypothetical protein [Armatimonadota bacterium]
MLKKTTLFILLCLFSQLFGITINSGEQEGTCKPIIEFYADNLVSAEIAGQGYAGVADIGDISFSNLNPASFDVQDDAQIYYEFGSKNNTNIFSDIDNADYEIERYRSGVAVAFAYKLSEFLQAGLIFTQKNSYAVDLGEVSNYDNYGVIIESFSLYEKRYIHSVNLPFSYIHGKFRFGLGLNLDLYHSEIRNVYMQQNGYWAGYSGELDFVLFRPKLGAIYSPLQNLSLGLSFILPTEKKLTTECNWGDLEHNKNKFPMEILVGTKYSIPNIPFSVLLDFSHKHYSDMPEFVDSNDFRFGLEYALLEKLHIRTGMFTSFDIRDTDYTTSDGQGNEFDYWPDSNTFEDRKFLTCGLSYLWKRTKFNLAVLDNSLLTDSDLKQTYVKLGFTIQLAHQ